MRLESKLFQPVQWEELIIGYMKGGSSWQLHCLPQWMQNLVYAKMSADPSITKCDEALFAIFSDRAKKLKIDLSGLDITVLSKEFLTLLPAAVKAAAEARGFFSAAAAVPSAAAALSAPAASKPVVPAAPLSDDDPELQAALLASLMEGSAAAATPARAAPSKGVGAAAASAAPSPSLGGKGVKRDIPLDKKSGDLDSIKDTADLKKYFGYLESSPQEDQDS